MNVIVKDKDAKIMELCKLLLEARDALPAITELGALQYGVDLTLADRIEHALLPWLVTDEAESE